MWRFICGVTRLGWEIETQGRVLSWIEIVFLVFILPAVKSTEQTVFPHVTRNK